MTEVDTETDGQAYYLLLFLFVALFQKNDCRRFRMKFSKTSDRSAMENCRHFVSAVSPQIPVREMPVAAGPESDSQVQMEDSQVVSPDSQQVSKGTKHDAGYSSTASAATSGLTLPDLAQKVTRLFDSDEREGRRMRERL